VALRVTNHLAGDTSVHWHGIILPFEMGGVPGLSFGGIRLARLRIPVPVKQSGTYWHHSHSGMQEQTVVYGAIVIDPLKKEPFAYDREYVVLLSDWSDESPAALFSRLRSIPFADAEPLRFTLGERLRITLVNDTMMNHPIHLHGMWSDLETGDGDYLPRKHTVIVQPGAKLSYLVTANAPGCRAYHCHLLYHMMGMFREVHVG
jgi:FtsP/CotA-like multicopper oxidase with cupredoxin domain